MSQFLAQKRKRRRQILASYAAGSFSSRRHDVQQYHLTRQHGQQFSISGEAYKKGR